MRWQLRAFLYVLAFAAGSFVLDQVVFTLRGSPSRQVDVRVVTAMELKNHKEDFGNADLQQVTCEATLLPFPAPGGWSLPCWWLQRHREVVRRY